MTARDPNSSIQALALERYFDKSHLVTALTGAGISAASGIPTFRGPEGYWTIGSKVYMPQELATLAMFRKNPEEVWKWYLYRLGVCHDARPNAGHLALAAMEIYLGDRFRLITQNIDNLHLLAGNNPDRVLQIHGNINFTRCSRPCRDDLRLLPVEIRRPRAMGELTDAEQRQLHCEECGAWLRPHVLWFDEYYDERHYRFESALSLARQTDLLIIAGTSGATTLPTQIAHIAYDHGATILDINTEESPFSELARSSPGGAWIEGKTEAILPLLAERFCAVPARRW